MKYIIITTALALLFFNSCVTTPQINYVQNDTGFEVDVETTAIIVSGTLMDKDVTYEDELVRIADMLENIVSEDVVTEETIREKANEALIHCSPSRRKNVLLVFDRMFKYYGNVAKRDGFTKDQSIATIQSMADGIFKAVEYYWVTCSE
jgi:hypothetical protein